MTTLKELETELKSKRYKVTYSEKFNTIYFDRSKEHKYTESVYQAKDGSFGISVKVKGVSYGSETPEQRQACLKIKNEHTEKLNNANLSVKFPVFAPKPKSVQTVASQPEVSDEEIALLMGGEQFPASTYKAEPPEPKEHNENDPFDFPNFND